MVGIYEQITVVIDSIFKGRGVKEAQSTIQRFGSLAKATGKPLIQMQELMDKAGLAVTDTGQVFEKTTGKVIKQEKAVGLLRKQTGRFRMEYLSLMFISMAISRTLWGMITPVMELTGIFDIFGVMLQTLLLPVLIPLLDILIPIMEWFMNLSEPVRFAIGLIILLTAVFFSIMLVISQLTLFTTGWGATLGAIFKGIWGFGAGIAKTFMAAIPAILPIITIIGGIVLILAGVMMIVKNWGKDWKQVWRGIGLVVMGIGLLLLLVLGPIGWAIVALGAAIFFLAKYYKKIWEGLKWFFKGVADFFVTCWKVAVAIFMVIWNAISGFFKTLWEGMKVFVKGFADFVIGIFKGIWDWIQKIIEPIKAVIGFVKGGVRKLFGFQYGGIVPTTGPYMLHAGERVIPATKAETPVIFSPTITVYANLASDMDVRSLADQLSRYWVADFNRIAKTRGV